MSHPPFALEGIDHVVLLVRDMAEAQQFYEQVLGCTVDRELPEYGMLQLRAGVARWGRQQRVSHVVEILDEAYRLARKPV